MGGQSIQVVQGDITQFATKAIVNAANERMLGGSGVNGAIHRAAGPQLIEACRKVKEVKPGVRCPTGEARITPAFDLPADYVIHTVGPVWYGGSHNEKEQLSSAYRTSMALAEENGCESISFPCISTGVFMFPFEQACKIALDTIQEFSGRGTISEVLLVCFSVPREEEYRKILSAHPLSD